MVLKANSKIRFHPNSKTAYLTIPSDLVIDSQFPFKNSQNVLIEISDNELVIRPLEKDEGGEV